MTDKPENPPAFPGMQQKVMIPAELQNDPRIAQIKSTCNGMTLRDYFAAAAMQGILAAGKEQVAINGEYVEIDTAAYEIADAMLKARAK